jgi:hypothetical protein
LLVRQAARRPTARTPVIDADEPVIVRVADLEIHETYVEIRDRETGEIVVTVIELTSPWNKFPGPGRELYKKKQKEILASQSHLVEIDLLSRYRDLASLWRARTRMSFSTFKPSSSRHTKWARIAIRCVTTCPAGRRFPLKIRFGRRS